MHDVSASHDDSSLLESWADEQSEPAFSALVERYQSLVFGAALRRAGQPELARDVAQQVFSLVATRARLLVGHANIAGWLYRSATHLTARALRGERRRQERHERAAQETGHPEGEAERWLPLEQAMESLGARDREAIVLHFFQDLSYPEMARALGIEEAAARQRVSRALTRLGEILRRHGYAGSAATLLAGAVAWTSTADAVALTGATILAAGTAASPVSLILSTIMSHTASKITATVATLAFVPLLFQWNTHAKLQAAVAQLPPPLTVKVSPAALGPVDEKGLEAMRANRLKIERHAADLERLAANADQEVFVSFGSVDEVARKAARSLLRLIKVMEAEEKAKAEGKSNPLQAAADAVAAAQVMLALPELFATLKNIRRIETDATKAGRFYATFFGELLEIPPEAREPYQTRFTEWVSRLQSEGLALPQRPKENSGPWDWRRVQAMEKMMDLLKDAPVGAAQKDRLKELLADDSGAGHEAKPGSKKDEEEAKQMLDMIFGGAK